jgi:hypothetical protein
MTAAWVVVVASVAGAISTEWLLRCLRSQGSLRRRWKTSQACLRDFHNATGDDARQARLLQAGRETIGVSVLLLGILLVFAVILAAPAIALAWTSGDMAVYLGAATASAVIWWFFRAR